MHYMRSYIFIQGIKCVGLSFSNDKTLNTNCFCLPRSSTLMELSKLFALFYACDYYLTSNYSCKAIKERFHSKEIAETKPLDHAPGKDPASFRE